MQPVIGCDIQEERGAGARRALIVQGCEPPDVQMIERVPGPHDLQIRIEDDDHVPENIDRTWPLDVRQNLLDGPQYQYPSVRQPPRLMVERADGAHPERGELLIDSGGVGFEHGHAGEIELANDLLRLVAHGVFDNPEEVSSWLGARNEGNV